LLTAEPNGDEIDNVGNSMRLEIPKTLAAFAWIQKMMDGETRNGVTIKGAAGFEAAASQVRIVSAKIEMLYPRFDQETAEESIAQFKRGEFITVEALIEELTGESQSVIVPTHEPSDSKLRSLA
jgi:hypothetical protein